MPFLHSLAGVFVAICWGGNFIAAKFGLQEISPIFITFMRFVAVSLMVVPFVKVPKAYLKQIFMLSTVLGIGHFALLFIALKSGLSISTMVIVGQLGVPFACILGIFFLNDKVGIWRTTGLVIAFSGIFFIFGAPDVTTNITGFAIVVFAAFFWAVGNIIMKKMEDVKILHMIGWMSLFAAPQLLITSLIFEDGHMQQLSNISYIGIVSVCYTAVFSTIIAYSVWYYLIRVHPVSQVAPFSLLVPVFSIFLAVLIFNESLSINQIIGGALTIAGVAIIVIRRPKTAIAVD